MFDVFIYHVLICKKNMAGARLGYFRAKLLRNWRKNAWAHGLLKQRWGAGDSECDR